jgi:hypothetical protein
MDLLESMYELSYRFILLPFDKGKKMKLKYKIYLVILLLIFIFGSINGFDSKKDNNHEKIAIGKKIPFDKFKKYGSPKTLKGTNNTYWIAYLPKIDMTFKSIKKTDIIIATSKGRKPNL